MNNEITNNEFDVKADENFYQVKPQDHVDMIFYSIKQGAKYLFTVGLNEDAEWELCEVCDEMRHSDKHESLIKKIGEAIEGYSD